MRGENSSQRLAELRQNTTDAISQGVDMVYKFIQDVDLQRDGEMLCFVATSVITSAVGLVVILPRMLDQSKSDGHNEFVYIRTLEDLRQYEVGGMVRDVLAMVWQPRVAYIKVTGHGAKIPRVPKGVMNLKNLKEMNLSGNAIRCIPEDISKLRQLEALDVSDNYISSLPDSISKLTSLKKLNAMNNQIEMLPESFGWLRSLEVLGLKNNRLVQLPLSFGHLTSLRQLYLTDNCLNSLPETISGCNNLVKLQASHNKLTRLPDGIGKLQKLELLRVACCDIEDIGEGVKSAGSLSWFSIAGNPIALHPPKKASIPKVKYEHVSIGKKIGDGASGEVFEAEYKGRTVALKVFRDDKSPDGHCEDELNIACMLHDPNLVKVIGRVEEPLGIIMEYIHGVPLALKPDGVSLLRCRWKDECYSIAFVLRCIAGVAGALEHMHSKGIAHGDVYAHNVLVSEDGTSVLCDYGASFLYNKAHGYFELQEVRAFGIMIRDMVEKIDISFDDMEQALEGQKQLLFIVSQCMSVEPDKRPKFAALARKLRSMERAASSSGTPRSDSRLLLSRKRADLTREGWATAR